MRKYFSQEERDAYNAQKREEANQQIVDLAKTWQDNPEDVAEFIRFQSRFHHYSARNKMLIYKQNPHASFVASMADFNEMGYWVRRGQHGMSISVYMPVTTFRTKPSAPWRSIRTASAQEKEMIKAGMLETHEEPHFGTGSVYDISQTTCPLSDYPKLLGLGYDSAQHAAIYKEIKRYCENIGIQVKERDVDSVTLRGFYDPRTRHITINDKLGDTQKLSTLIHEMSHDLIGHSPDSQKSSAQREFEADALSMMLESNMVFRQRMCGKATLPTATQLTAMSCKIRRSRLKSISSLSRSTTPLTGTSTIWNNSFRRRESSKSRRSS